MKAQQSTRCIYHVWPCYYKILETVPLRSCSYAFQKYSVKKKETSQTITNHTIEHQI